MKLFVAILTSLVCHLILMTQTRLGKSLVQSETQNWIEPLEISRKVATVGNEVATSHQKVLSREEIMKSGNRLPKYPELALERGWQGIVKLKLVLSGDGRVIESSVMESSGFEILDEAALKASYHWILNLAPGVLHVVAPVHFILES
jgi:TonB family protein